MDMTELTFTLDEATIRRLDDLAQQLARTKSEIVREALQQYHRVEKPTGQLSESEKQRMLQILDEFMRRARTRIRAEVDTELKEIRRARRHGGRKHRS